MPDRTCRTCLRKHGGNSQHHSPAPHPHTPSLILTHKSTLRSLLLHSFFHWIFSLFTFQMLSPSSISALETPILHEGSHLPTHPHLPHCPQIPLHWGIELSQEEGNLLPLMADKAILCYICSWSRGSLHVYSLVGDLVPGSSGVGV